MVDEPSLAAPKKSKTRSRIALGLLLLVFGFVCYGAFERSRLFAAAANEKEASAAIRALKGAVIDSTVQDWRVVFASDQPQVAQRVGGVYIPHEGEGPGYTQKVAKQLQAFALCNELIISHGPVSGGMRMGPSPKRILKPGEVAPEVLDLAMIRKLFPRLQVSGEEFLAPQEEATTVPKGTDSTAVTSKDEPKPEPSTDDTKKSSP